MDDPVAEIPHVIHLLTQSPPSIQRDAIEKYFTPNASFTHPFVRTGSWSHSRVLIQCIYRWYKIMSPRVEITVQSVAYDPKAQKLYIQIFQIFRIWVIPFYYAPVSLTTVLDLTYIPNSNSNSNPNPNPNPNPQSTASSSSKGKYYITSQNDLYQTNQFVKFVLPGVSVFVVLFGLLASFGCAVGALLGGPVTWVEERWGWGEGIGKGRVEWERKKKGWADLDGWSDGEVVRRSELRGRIIG
ncbi:hypothetical protein NX059_004858 [Plenodomus lindquistii]|nr:hypothetical protein NX059_004858 [Plenodomus lindquistii]